MKKIITLGFVSLTMLACTKKKEEEVTVNQEESAMHSYGGAGGACWADDIPPTCEEMPQVCAEGVGGSFN